MTDEEFEVLFTSLTKKEKLNLIARNCRRITSQNGDSYSIEGSIENLEAFLYQVLYEQLTGREQS